RVLDRVRWWHALLFCGLLLVVVTAVGHAIRPASAPGAQPAPSTSSSISALPSYPKAAPSPRRRAEARVARGLVRVAPRGVVSPARPVKPGALKLDGRQG